MKCAILREKYLSILTVPSGKEIFYRKYRGKAKLLPSLFSKIIINNVDTNITADTNTIKGDTMEKKTGATGIKNTIEKDSILQFESSSSSSPSSQKNYSEKQNNMSSNSATGSSLAMSLSANFNLHPNQRRF